MLTVKQANEIREIAKKDDKLMEMIMLFDSLTPAKQDLILRSMRDLVSARFEARKGA